MAVYYFTKLYKFLKKVTDTSRKEYNSGDMMDTLKQHEYFYQLIKEADEALTSLSLLVVNESGIEHLYKTLKEKKISPAYGSLRLDRDKNGTIFLQEYRPAKSLFKKGHFQSIQTEQPFWEAIGSALIRLVQKKKRESNQLKNNQEFYLILQGNMQKEYFKILLEQGRFSYDTKQNHLQEEPVFAALSVLAQLQKDQIIETRINDTKNLRNKLSDEVEKTGHSIQEIACIVGKNEAGEFYTAPREHKSDFNVNVCQYKIIPIEIGRAISMVKRALLQNKNLLILDQLTLDTLCECFYNRNNYYFKAS
jgi:hypothetical protein